MKDEAKKHLGVGGFGWFDCPFADSQATTK
jgi:hypothetical protein